MTHNVFMIWRRRGATRWFRIVVPGIGLLILVGVSYIVWVNEPPVVGSKGGSLTHQAKLPQSVEDLSARQP